LMSLLITILKAS